MGTTYHWPALVTLATLLLLFGCAWYVGVARGRYQVKAPAMTGPEEFNRAFRVQMNTVENTVAFLPALWLASIYFSPRIAAVIGAVWVVARVWYALAYAREPRSRGMAYTISNIACGALIGLATWGLFTAPLW
jgi:uncharacterized MAPEG superfamily protein